MLTSTRRSISYPNPDRSDISDVPAHIKILVDALEVDPVYVQGTNAARLAANHMAGVIWYATDTGLFWWDTGTTWVQMAPVLPRQVTGVIAANGTITAGTGFTIVKGTTGVYTVTFSPVFSARPVVVATINESPVSMILMLNAVTASGFGVLITDRLGNTDDRIWNFAALTVA